jgi:glycosyltransferase involved in cell wall biosynthesis
MLMQPQRRPRVVILADRHGWALEHEARDLAGSLGGEFETRIAFVPDEPDLAAIPFDLLVVLFWADTYHQRFVHDPRKIVKQVASHRWAFEPFGPLSPKQFVDRHLWDAATVVCVSERLHRELSPHREVLHVPQGVDTDSLRRREPRQGPIVFGWVGRARAPQKGLADILRPAASRDFELRVAGGELSWEEMIRFYHAIDVLCVASVHEGEPRPLIEGMAAGCFPVAVDVGVVPELVRHGVNGLIVRRSVAAFRAAFQWCVLNPEVVRPAGLENARVMAAVRDRRCTASAWGRALRRALTLRLAAAPE